MKAHHRHGLAALRERQGNGDLDRRTFLGLAAALAATAGLQARWIGPALAAVTEVRFDGWGGVVQEAIDKYAFQPYTKKSGVKVVQGTFGDESEIITKVKTANPGDFQIIHSSGRRILQALCRWRLPHRDQRGQHSQSQARHAGDDRAVPQDHPEALLRSPYDYGTTGIAYNTKVISEAEAKEKGAKLLIDPKYKDKIGGYGDMITRVWYGALQSGQNPNDIKDIDAVWAKVAKAATSPRNIGIGCRAHGSACQGERSSSPTPGPAASPRCSSRATPSAISTRRGATHGWRTCWCSGDCADGRMRAAHQLHARAADIDRGRRRPELSPALDPGKVEMTEKIKKLPAFDPTGTMKALTFADPNFWAPVTDQWTKQWDRIAKGA